MNPLKFTKIPTETLRNWFIPLPCRFLLTVLQSYCYGDKRQCWPTAETLAKICGCKPRAIYRWAKQLEGFGLIERRPKDPNSKKSVTLYTLTYEKAERRLQKLADKKRVLVSVGTPLSVSVGTHKEDVLKEEAQEYDARPDSDDSKKVIPMPPQKRRYTLKPRSAKAAE